MFYLLSFITGILECGWIAFGVIQALPLCQILCYPLAYHIGNLFPQPFSLNKGSLRLIGFVSIICSFITFAATGTVCTILTCISLFGISSVIQSVRSGLKSDGNRFIKRVFRVCGFVLAPLACVIPSEILSVSAIIALYTLKNYSGICKIDILKNQDGYSCVMLFHQLHYFFYAHITLAAMSIMLVNKESEIGVVFGVLLFIATWITYMLVEPIVSMLTNRILLVFYIGHIGISIILLSMSFLTNDLMFIVLWIITGFGGGVVYTISARAKLVCSYDKKSMTISENIGHTLGLLTATVIASFFEKASLHIMLILGAASALFTVLSMTFILRKENRYEIIKNNS